MKKYSILLCLLVAFLFMSCSSKVTTSVAGYVKDSSGRPIEGAEISLSSPEALTGKTDATTNARSGVDGSFMITLNHPPSDKLWFTVKKQGYNLVYTKTFTNKDAPKGSFDVVLTKLNP